MNKTLRERLQFDADHDFVRLMRAFVDRQFPIVPSPMEKHFAIAREKPNAFSTQGPVLAVSIGGTNSKLMIASNRDGNLQVHHIHATLNPALPTPMEKFFDEFILQDDRVRNFLTEHGSPGIGFSIPVPMPEDGVFCHISKVEGITGLIARDLRRDAPTHHFGRNFRRYMAERNIPVGRLFYYSDTVIAHHGGMSTCELQKGDKTILLVSGTGMATGDEGNFVLTCWAPLLNTDEELYPVEVTEGYQYQFCSAGKGLFNLMDRAVKIRAREPGSALIGQNISRYFRTTKDSRTVAHIWESTLPGGHLHNEALQIYEQVGEEAFTELQWIATSIMDRAVSAIANSAVGTFVHMGMPESGRGHIVFFEGSVVKNFFMLPRIKTEILRLIRNRELFDRLGLPRMPDPLMEPEMIAINFDKSVNDNVFDELDYTLIGAATAAMAENCLDMPTFAD